MKFIKDLLESSRDDEVNEIMTVAKNIKTRKDFDKVENMLRAYDKKHSGLKNSLYSWADFLSGRWKEPKRIEPLMKVIARKIEEYDLLRSK